MFYLSKEDSNPSFDSFWLINWSEDFYISIIEANFVKDLHKFSKIFHMLCLFSDLAKKEILIQEPKYFNKLNTIKEKWKNNEFNIASLEKEIRQSLIELNKQNNNYQITFLLKEIKKLLEEKNFNYLEGIYIYFNKSIMKKIDYLTNLEKDQLIKRLENILQILKKQSFSNKALFDLFIYQ